MYDSIMYDDVQLFEYSSLKTEHYNKSQEVVGLKGVNTK